MIEPTKADVESYYDVRVEGKLRDFTHANPRIEAAIETLAEWAPANPSRVLELGCGIGATTWRMARAWPGAEVIGVDISPASIDVARTCFQLRNLRYQVGLIEEGILEGKFDLILLMDVYEHISRNDRSAIHCAIRALLSDESRLIVSVPTPATQQYGRQNNPADMQPVDEDIDIDALKVMAVDTQVDILYYRLVGIWNYGDYAHVVFGRFKSLAPVAIRRHLHFSGRRQWLKRFLGIANDQHLDHHDYLGNDVMRKKRREVGAKFGVPSSHRHRLAKAWLWRAGR